MRTPIGSRSWGSRPARTPIGSAIRSPGTVPARSPWRPRRRSTGWPPAGIRRRRGAGVGRDGLVAVASHPDVDIVLCASSGTEGLEAVLAAIDHGKTVALANKEVLVMAGGIVTDAARRAGVAILPVDSEHNAIHQCLHGRSTGDVKRIVLTASGGPFRGRTPSQLQTVSAADALQHPTWRMGRKITIDSATLMNKGLEVIEAHWLFGLTRSADRCRRPPAVGRALDGRARGWIDHRAARRDRHAPADPVRVLVSRSMARAAGAARPDGRRTAGVRGARRECLSVPRPGVPCARGRNAVCRWC